MSLGHIKDGEDESNVQDWQDKKNDKHIGNSVDSLSMSINQLREIQITPGLIRRLTEEKVKNLLDRVAHLAHDVSYSHPPSESSDEPSYTDDVPEDFLQAIGEPIELSIDEERKLIKEYHRGKHSEDAQLKIKSEEARRKLISAHLPIVVSMARHFANERMGFEDLIGEGMVGLLQVIDQKFKLGTGQKRLACYALWKIFIRMRTAILEMSHGALLVTRGVWDKDTKHTRQHAKNLTNQSAGSTPTQGSLIELEYPISERIGQFLTSRICFPEIDINQEIQPGAAYYDADETTSIAETLPDENTPDPFAYTAFQEMREKLRKALSRLEEKEAKIVAMHAGVAYEKEFTLEQIGKELDGFSKEWMRILEAKALKKLSNVYWAKELREYMDYGPRDYKLQKVLRYKEEEDYAKRLQKHVAKNKLQHQET